MSGIFRYKKLVAVLTMLAAEFVVTVVAVVQAGELTPAELYSRCFVRMVRRPLPAMDPILAQVNVGTLTAPRACLNLFDKAQLGQVSGRLADPSNGEAQEIVRTFQMLHRTFFQSRATVVDNVNFRTVQALLSDMEEPALYFTRAALQNSVRFDSVVTLNQPLRGVRVRPPSTLTKYQSQRLHRYASAALGDTSGLTLRYRTPSNTNMPFEIPDSELIDFGTLVGIEPAIQLRIPFAQRPAVVSSRTQLLNALAAQLVNVDVRRHFGGGIIGSQGFLHANANLQGLELPQGEELINRRVSARVFQDLLCQQLPSLTAADVAGDVNPSSPYPFRRSASCMQCHTSVDPLAGTLRNIVFLRSASLLPRDGAVNSFGFGLNPVSGSTDENLQMPAGRLSYRENISGDHINVPVTGLSDVGQRLAGGDDLYLCAAKRYYQFFTGINVPLRTLDSRAANYALNKRHQDFVVHLGQRLKATQSVRTVFDLIFQSPTFRTRNYLSEVSQ
jgi:hypothetical protein